MTWAMVVASVRAAERKANEIGRPVAVIDRLNRTKAVPLDEAQRSGCRILEVVHPSCDSDAVQQMHSRC